MGAEHGPDGGHDAWEALGLVAPVAADGLHRTGVFVGQHPPAVQAAETLSAGDLAPAHLDERKQQDYRNDRNQAIERHRVFHQH